MRRIHTSLAWWEERWVSSLCTMLPTHHGVYAFLYIPGYTDLTPTVLYRPPSCQCPRTEVQALERDIAELNIRDAPVTVVTDPHVTDPHVTVRHRQCDKAVCAP